MFASAYHAGGPVAYARDGNPTWTALEDVLGDLEGGTAIAFASGMAATAAVFDQVPIGGAIVVPRDGYYGTRAFLDAAVAGRWEMRPVDIADTDATLDACDGAQLLWIESPTNPLLDVADIPTLASAAQARGLVVAVDNTLMTPLGQRPLELGADLVVHSATKLLAGHSDVLLGAVVAGEGTGRCDSLRQRRSLAGAVPGTMETYLALRGVRTLPLASRTGVRQRTGTGPPTFGALRGRTRPVPRPAYRPWPPKGPSPDGQLRYLARLRGVRRCRRSRGRRPLDTSHRARDQPRRYRDHPRTPRQMAGGSRSTRAAPPQRRL